MLSRSEEEYASIFRFLNGATFSPYGHYQASSDSFVKTTPLEALKYIRDACILEIERHENG